MESISHVRQTHRTPSPTSAAAITIALLAVSALLVRPADGKSDEVVRTPSGVTYVTGGAGTEAVDQLKSMEKDFNLKLVFASTSGAYVSDVKVTIVDARGQTVLDVTSEGPLLMAKLTPGGYQVNAAFGGRLESRKVTVAANKLTTLDFRWAVS
jgi:hypothetical protein